MAKKKYNEDFPLLAEGFARRGMIDKEIAKSLGISEWTFYQYMKNYPQFTQAIKKGKAPVDFEVENLLLKRCRGFEYEETLVEYKPEGLKEDEKPKPVLIRKTQKMVIPDTTAQIFWLKNRQSKYWKDKQDLLVSGNLSLKVITAVPRSKKRKEDVKP